MRDDIVKRLREMLVDDLFVDVPQEQIKLDDGLQSVAGVDSLGFVELRVLSERNFGVKIEDADFVPEHFRNLRCLAVLIERLQTETA